MGIKTYIVDSFTDSVFKGNPAGVCFPVAEIPDHLMLAIARELGLSETAFVFSGESRDDRCIRYFSPKMEIPLCGHATLASAKVIFATTAARFVSFRTVQGIILPVESVNDQIVMQFPVYETEPAEAKDALLAALGLTRIRNAVFNQETKILLLEIDGTEILAGLDPDFEALYKSSDSINGVLVTSRSNDAFDFHSRYFWPWSGTNEDPVTGGTHTFLAKYWSERLGKTKMRSFQSSRRSGFMDVEIIDNTVIISGKAVIVFRGELVADSTLAHTD